MKKIKLIKTIIKNYIIQFIIVTLIFYIISYIIIEGVESSYYDHIAKDALNLTKGYSLSLSKAAEAKDTINLLLEQKLHVAIKTTASYDKSFNNSIMKKLSDMLEVDEIDYYNSDGEIIYSNMDSFIGWKVHIGHPVYNFMINDRNIHFDEIRQDSISGEFYKYGYFKVSDGFIQIGVKADKIYNLLGKFEIQTLLNELHNNSDSNSIIFIDNDLNIIESKENKDVFKTLIDNEIQEYILNDKEYVYIDFKNKRQECLTLVPIYLEENKIGTLIIAQQLRDIYNLINKITITVLFALILIYALITYSMLVSYKKDKKLINVAYFDELTLLPNNQYLKEVICDDLNEIEIYEKALFLINISNFRLINTLYGYEYGDEIIKKVSRELEKLANEFCYLFRFSGDKFIIYLSKYKYAKELNNIISKINQIFNKPFIINDIEQNLTVHIGIVEFNNNKNYDQILKEATISISQLKYNDSLNYKYFNEVMENKLKREELIVKEIRKILSENNDNLYLEFQPLVDFKTNNIIGFEVLSRMKTDNLGQVSPNEFIEVAEKNQLIIPLGNLILIKACEFLQYIDSIGFDYIKIAVNISGFQLFEDNFLNKITNIINKTNIKPSNLELEITESVFLEDYKTINGKFKKLKDEDVKIILDDFGTGYSSFSRLRELNIDALKIDKYFISKISESETKELLIGDIITMAHKMGLKVVAEGVENERQRNYLYNTNCDIMQGYFFSKPLSEEDSIELLKNSILLKNNKTK